MDDILEAIKRLAAANPGGEVSTDDLEKLRLWEEMEFRKRQNTMADGKTLRPRLANNPHNDGCTISERTACTKCLKEFWPDSVYLTMAAITGEHP